MLENLAAKLDEELRSGDDRALWEDVAARVADDVAGLDVRMESPPRHVVFAIARIRRHRPGVHPDENATLHLAWERERGESGFRFAGPNPRLRRRRGSWSATVCLPVGTNSLAWVEALVLWRPGLPWAEREDHETGRQTYRYRREADGSWSFLGVRDE